MRRFGRQQACRGFTLVEVLIVIAIIVLAVTLAVPAIRGLTGSRSQEAAQNTIAAFLSRARAEAIGLQRTEGVLFYLDSANDRVTCAQVYVADAQNRLGVSYLDLVPDRDPLPLPTGVRLETLLDSVESTTSADKDAYHGARYLGYNNINPTNRTDPMPAYPGGVVLFDSLGRVVSNQYGFLFYTQPAAGGKQATALGSLLFGGGAQATQLPTDRWPGLPQTGGNPFAVRSTMGFVLCQEDALKGRATAPDNDPTDQFQASNPQEMSNWLDVNATPIFINRYTGAIFSAE